MCTASFRALILAVVSLLMPATKVSGQTAVPGLAMDPAEHILLEIDPLLNVGSQISAQVRCRLASGAVINGDLRILDNGVVVADSRDAGTTVVSATFFSAPGPHVYECDYTNGIHSSATGTQIVEPVPQPTDLTFELFSVPDPAAYGRPVVIGGGAAPFASGMTGRLRITEGSAVLLDQPLDAAGRVSVIMTTLAPGHHTFHGAFTVTVRGKTIQSGRSLTQMIRAAPTLPVPAPRPDFSITPATSLLTIPVGRRADVILTLKSLDHFDGIVRLSCGNLPPVATCVFNAAQYALSSTATATFTIATSPVSLQESRTARTIVACALPLPMLFMLRRRRFATRRGLLALLVAAVALAMTACSMPPTYRTAAGAYAVTINATGTSGGTVVTHTFPFRLTVTTE